MMYFSSVKKGSCHDCKAHFLTVGSVLTFPPMLLGSRLIRSDLRGKDLIISKMQEMLTLLVGDLDPVKPLYHPASNLTRDDQSEREAVVWAKRLPIHAPCD